MLFRAYIGRLAAFLLLFAVSVARAEEAPSDGPLELPAPVAVPNLSCIEYLQQQATRRDEIAAPWQTVYAVRAVRGRWGALFLLERESGHPWLATYGFTPVTGQGDPRTFVDSIGADVAGFFAFFLLTSHRMVAGGPVELSGAIRVLNGWLPPNEAIPTTFYGSSGNDLREYIRRYAEDGGLPISPGRTTRIHDLSAHVATILAPRPLALHSQRQAGAVSRFEAFVRRTLPNFAATVNGGGLLRRLLLTEVPHIDTGTSTVSSVFSPDPGIERVWLAYETLGNQGRSPREHLHSLLTTWHSHGTEGMTGTPLTEEHAAALRVLMGAYEAFAAEEQGNPDFERRLLVNGAPYLSDSSRRGPWLAQLNRLCESFRRRREQLRAAIHANGGGNLAVPANVLAALREQDRESRSQPAADPGP